MPHDEQILVIPADVIAEIGTIDGFEADVERFLPSILRSDRLQFHPRADMESDPSYKQLIPYVVLQWTDDAGTVRLFRYTRGGGSVEKRLHAKQSIGIGGHVNADDCQGEADLYTNGMRRELAEEVVIGCPYDESREGLIYDPSDDVGRVHLGVVHRFRLELPEVRSNEEDLAEGHFASLDELRESWGRLETWSRLVLEALYGVRGVGPTDDGGR